MSIGVLTIMMLLAGQVFKLSIDSTSQATSLIEINQSFRLLEEALREDLAGIDPERSMMVISANPIDAYWTGFQQEGDIDGDPLNGYPHDPDPEREDLVGPDGLPGTGDEIGINGNPAPPYPLHKPRADVLMFFTTNPATSETYPAASSNLVQVVYGHAEIGELDNTGAWTTMPIPFPVAGTYFSTPAQNWHLARRKIILVDDNEDALDSTFMAGNDDLRPSPDEGMAPMVYPLSDGMVDVIAKDELGGNELFFHSQVIGEPTEMIPDFDTLLRWSRRSRIDLAPPPAVANRLGHYFLNNCASFKVEWGFTHPIAADEIIWVDPGNVGGSVIAAFDRLSVPATNPVRMEFEGLRRFDPNGPTMNPADYSDASTHMFFAKDFDFLGDTDAPDPLFPRVLRITVDIFDRPGRLNKPLRHVMVLPVGGG